MNNYVRVIDGIVVEAVRSDVPIEQLFHPDAGFVEAQDAVEVGYLYINKQFVPPKPSDAHEWDGTKWVVDKDKQAELDKQAVQSQLKAIEAAIQEHIDSTAQDLQMGFITGVDLMKYAGFANVFQPIAEAFGAWVADIWYQAAQTKASIMAGNGSIPTIEQAVAMIPDFVFSSNRPELP